LAQAAVFYNKIVSVAGNRVIVNHADAEQHLRTHSRAERCAGGKDGAGCRYERVYHGER